MRTADAYHQGVRLRVGVGLWVLSWVPYGIILGLSGVWLTLSWAFEVLLGLAGIALAGQSFAAAVKASGWRRAPGIAWHTLRTGHDAPAPQPSTW